MYDSENVYDSEKQSTAAGDAIHPAAVATTKCPPLCDRDSQAHRHVGFAEATEIGDIPEIIGNGRGLYEGDLAGYFRVPIFHATNLTRPYHNLRHMLHVTWLCHRGRNSIVTVLPRRSAIC